MNLLRVRFDLVGWGCCMSSSFSKLSLSQKREVYYQGETVEIVAELDNSACNVDLVGMKVWIEQTITLKQGDKKHTDTRIVKE